MCDTLLVNGTQIGISQCAKQVLLVYTIVSTLISTLSFYSWLGSMMSVSDFPTKSLKSKIHKKAIGIRLEGHRKFIVLLCSSKI